MEKINQRVMPQTYFIGILALSIIFYFIFPINKIIFPPYIYTGWLLILFGIILNLWTDRIFKKNKTTVKPYEIPTSFEISGPFSISRHPMYLGMALVLFGIAILHGTLITFIFPIIFIILMEIIFIPEEEKNLGKKFRKKYLNYKKKVRRWI
jgi:protein-S-isoprenylcysteine O-methyltransferase Ste14